MNRVLGILGGGQLGQMLAEAAKPLGVDVLCFDPSREACAQTQCQVIHAEYDDFAALERFCNQVERVGVEFENVPLDSVRFVASRRPFYPSLLALEIAQDRLKEKTFFRTHGIRTNEFVDVQSLEDLLKGIDHVGIPAILKTRTLGYDGKGQYRIKSVNEAEEAWTSLGQRPCILEAYVPFDFESSCVSVRTDAGEIVSYEPALNTHKNGILLSSLVPAKISDSVQGEMQRASRVVGEALRMVGTFAVEFFISRTAGVVAGEIAPRVHNTGHWTQDGAETSQFENHVRALMGLKLGSVKRRVPTRMYNILGRHIDRNAVEKIPGTHLHDYGKTAKAGRKLGHINLLSGPQDVELSEELQAQVDALFKSGSKIL